MIVACESALTHAYVCVPTGGWGGGGGGGGGGGSGGMTLDPLRLLLTQSGTRLLFNTCDKAHTQFQDFWGEGLQGLPLSMKPCLHIFISEFNDYSGISDYFCRISSNISHHPEQSLYISSFVSIISFFEHSQTQYFQ